MVWGVALSIIDRDPAPLITAIGATAPLLALAVLGGLRPYVSASTSGLVIQNPFTRREVAWDDVVDVVPSYHGLEVVTHGETVSAWAVQKSNIARWLGRRTRADDVAGTLIALRDKQTGGHTP